MNDPPRDLLGWVLASVFNVRRRVREPRTRPDVPVLLPRLNSTQIYRRAIEAAVYQQHQFVTDIRTENK